MRKIRKRCGCGCGEITNYGKMYVLGHSQRGKKHTAESIKKMSEAKKGKKQTAERILKRSLANMKYNSNDPYCDVWKSREYKRDIRKDYCENTDCKKDYKKLDNHHICLDKKKCAPIDIMTMCHSCHMILHNKLRRGTNKAANPKDYIIINRPDHVSYIHKESRTVIRIKRR